MYQGKRLGSKHTVLPMPIARHDHCIIMTIVQEITAFFHTALGIHPGAQLKLAVTLLIIVLAEVGRRLVLRFLLRRATDNEAAYRWNRTSKYINFAIIFFLIGRVWIEGFQSLITYLGLLSAGLAIALQDVLKNFAGWLFILWRKPFDLGDRVQIGKDTGDVIDMRLFQFTLLEVGNWVDADQSTGRLIHIPNGRVFTESTANYYQGFNYTWSEVRVLVTFESNWRSAKVLLGDIASKHSAHLSEAAAARVREAARRYMIHYKHLTPIVYTSVQDSGVLLTVRYLCEPRRRRFTDQLIWEDTLGAIENAPDIDLAYQTTRFYVPEDRQKLRPARKALSKKKAASRQKKRTVR